RPQSPRCKHRRSQQGHRHLMTVPRPSTRSAALRSALDHPVIDADGHFTELLAVFDDYVEEYGGTKAGAALAETSRRLDTYFEDTSDPRLRRERGGTGLPLSWTLPTPHPPPPST